MTSSRMFGVTILILAVLASGLVSIQQNATATCATDECTEYIAYKIGVQCYDLNAQTAQTQNGFWADDPLGGTAVEDDESDPVDVRTADSCNKDCSKTASKASREQYAIYGEYTLYSDHASYCDDAT